MFFYKYIYLDSNLDKKFEFFYFCKKKEMNKSFITTIGFLLFIIGMLAFILSFVGIRFVFLSFLDQLGSPWSFLTKIIMILVGLILIYVSKTIDQPNP